jgi:hypothetical protein
VCQLRHKLERASPDCLSFHTHVGIGCPVAPEPVDASPARHGHAEAIAEIVSW